MVRRLAWLSLFFSLLVLQGTISFLVAQESSSPVSPPSNETGTSGETGTEQPTLSWDEFEALTQTLLEEALKLQQETQNLVQASEQSQMDLQESRRQQALQQEQLTRLLSMQEALSKRLKDYEQLRKEETEAARLILEEALDKLKKAAVALSMYKKLSGAVGIAAAVGWVLAILFGALYFGGNR